MELATALDFARQHRNGTLATIKRDGRPQLSNILHWVDDAGLVRISITADRAKTRNLARDGRAALHVGGDTFWAYVVIEGDVELSPVAAAPDDATVEELVDLYRNLSGEHPDWDDYRQAQVRERRVVARLSPTHAYGLLPNPT